MGQLRQQSFDNRAPTTEPAAGSGWSDPATAPEAGSGWASTGAVSVTADPADPTDATGSSQQQGRQLVLEAGQVFPQYIPTSAAAGNGGKRGGCPGHTWRLWDSRCSRPDHCPSATPSAGCPGPFFQWGRGRWNASSPLLSADPVKEWEPAAPPAPSPLLLSSLCSSRNNRLFGTTGTVTGSSPSRSWQRGCLPRC